MPTPRREKVLYTYMVHIVQISGFRVFDSECSIPSVRFQVFDSELSFVLFVLLLIIAVRIGERFDVELPDSQLLDNHPIARQTPCYETGPQFSRIAPIPGAAS